MESSQSESKTIPEQRKEVRTSRFQIVKLEERIAPRKPACYPYGCPSHGHCGHGGCK